MKCNKCGETDESKFYPYNRWTCRHCHYLQSSARRTPESRHQIYLRRKVKAFAESKRSREKNRDIINMRQRERRSGEQYRLMDRLDCESRRVIGISAGKLNQSQMETLFYIRLFKLRQSNSVTQEYAKVIIDKLSLDPLTGLLELYKIKTTPNILGRQIIHNQYRTGEMLWQSI
jgi:hypothetical protein